MGYASYEIVIERHLAPELQHAALDFLHPPAFLLLQHLGLHQAYGAESLLHLLLIPGIEIHHLGDQGLEPVPHQLHQP